MRIPPHRASLALALCSLLLAAAAFADVPNRQRVAFQEVVSPHGGGGAAGQCSIVYYNLCSGWLWRYVGFGQGDEVGVAFDLPADCGWEAGDAYRLVGFWWYWRYANPGWGFTLTYSLQETEARYCKVGSPIGVLSGQDPVERWNSYPGFPATTESPWVALIATYDKGNLPQFCTDNNTKNYHAPNACPDYTTGPAHTLYWGGAITQYCPPTSFTDGWPVDCLMEAAFQEVSEDATEQASWSRVKSLFR